MGQDISGKGISSMRIKATISSDTGRVWMIVRRPPSWPGARDGTDFIQFQNKSVRMDWDEPKGVYDITLTPDPDI